ncbi:alpha/beta-hydrolase [Aspergillus violaceofuscus CBS 115571]|uniref:Alpha/beta-hydrolase n=1 Tax=Aspergillus violaceofuscus (strain CBS 115571) TaxID=1450538 RepID=A0A2V5GZK3_ASPV1|nr:alpha/beta-hydrolase [Aspergillus violaceofuscus CBS 115571]
MNRLANALILFMRLGLKAHSLHDQPMVYGFDNIEPSANLTWTPCFDAFGCSKLEVPLDYANRDLGTTSIAFIKLAGKNATVESPSIVLIPGGPGGSGVDLLLTYQTIVGQMFGEQYNFVSFDPRGVNNSGLHLDCFSGDTEARSAFYRLHRTGVTNTSSTSLEEQYYSSSIYGDWCNNAVENKLPHSYYVTTPAVAHDLLTFTEAEAQMAGQSPSAAKLWCYSISYGTVIGTTFASMFPDRVERMVLDGVLNAEQYYNNYWTDNVDQMDEAMETFSTFCHSAGPANCSFWGPTPANITARMDGIIRQLQNHPVPLSAVGDPDLLPTMVTYSDLKTLFLNTIYTPLASFPSMADILHQAEQGNFSALAGLYDQSNSITDARLAITCTDSYRRNKLTSIEEFGTWAEYTISKSKYIGDIYPIYLEGDISALKTPTSFPVLFASNTIDPITPLISARKMSSRFAGSVLLMQEAVGHTVIDQGASDCYLGKIQAYFQGIVPVSNTTCPRQYTPFIDSSPF